MKRFFSLAIYMITAFRCANAQNVQLRYGLGHNPHKNLSLCMTVATIVEMFKSGTRDSTFIFTDIGYKGDGAMDAYREISCEFNLTKNKQWAAHVKYSGGLDSGKTMDSYCDNRYQYAVLPGGVRSWASKDFSKTFSPQLMYRYQLKNAHTGAHPLNDFQLTEVWGTTFAKGLCTFSGFYDLWYDPNVNGKIILPSRLQSWFNLSTLKGTKDINLSLGAEIETSNNFVWNDKGWNNRFYAIPAVAARWVL